MTESVQRLVILGATGDLTRRLLLPGLGMLLAQRTDTMVEVWGVGRVALDATAWGAKIGNALVRGGCDDDRAMEVVAASRYVQLDVTTREGVDELLGPCGPTWPRSAGASASRSSRPGGPVRCRWTSTPRAPAAPRTGELSRRVHSAAPMSVCAKSAPLNSSGRPHTFAAA